jgi:hypothetical protein
VDLSSRLGASGFGGLEMLSEDSRFVERQPPDPPEVIAGTLAYMALEQPGANTPAGWPEGAVFEIVNQLDRGAGVIISDEERKRLAELTSRDLG